MFEAFRFNKSKASPSASANPSPARPAKRQKTTLTPTKSNKEQPTNGGGLVEKLGDETRPLRLIIIGHNPSAVAWQKHHYYANPSNWMWRILKDTGIIPLIQGITGVPEDDDLLPSVAGIGFTDVGTGVPGTDSSQFTRHHFTAWRGPFFNRLAAHLERVNKALGCRCGKCGAPLIVAFSGKRQFTELFAHQQSNKKTSVETSTAQVEQNVVRLQAAKPSTITLGRQYILPTGWPLPLDKTQVWVMSSTSGAAAMTREQRYAPWQALADRLAAISSSSSSTSLVCCNTSL